MGVMGQKVMEMEPGEGRGYPHSLGGGGVSTLWGQVLVQHLRTSRPSGSG